MKVLLVDDSGLSRKIQSKVLREVGVDSIVEAKNGLDALRRLEEIDYAVDLVLTDWNMPGMDGIQLIQELRKLPRAQRLPVIVVSSEGEGERIAQALSVGASSYVVKPFKKEILARKLIAVRAIVDIGVPASAAHTAAPAAAAGEVPTMEGDLDKVGFPELVTFLNFHKKTGELQVQLESGQAGVSFEQGDVKDAWIGRFATEDAFFSIARLRRGRFRFYEGRPPRAARVTQPTMSLLMEAMRQLDEEDAGDGSGA